MAKGSGTEAHEKFQVTVQVSRIFPFSKFFFSMEILDDFIHFFLCLSNFAVVQSVPCGSSGVACSKSVMLRLGSPGTEESITLTRHKKIPIGKFSERYFIFPPVIRFFARYCHLNNLSNLSFFNLFFFVENSAEQRTLSCFLFHLSIYFCFLLEEPNTELYFLFLSSKFRILVREAGLFIFIEVADLGLVLQWDHGTRIYLRLDPKWKGRVSVSLFMITVIHAFPLLFNIFASFVWVNHFTATSALKRFAACAVISTTMR